MGGTLELRGEDARYALNVADITLNDGKMGGDGRLRDVAFCEQSLEFGG